MRQVQRFGYGITWSKPRRSLRFVRSKIYTQDRPQHCHATREYNFFFFLLFIYTLWICIGWFISLSCETNRHEKEISFFFCILFFFLIRPRGESFSRRETSRSLSYKPRGLATYTWASTIFISRESERLYTFCVWVTFPISYIVFSRTWKKK